MRISRPARDLMALCALVATLLLGAACERDASQGADEPSAVDDSEGAEPAQAGTNAQANRSWRIQTGVAEGSLTLRVEPGSGFKINEEFPWQLQVEERSLGSADALRFDEDAVEMSLAVPESASGAVEGQLRFSVCNDTTCLTPRETVRWEL